jgi:hypothetical protein
MTTRPNHLGAALQRHRRADPLGGAGEANPGCAPKVRFAVDSPLEGGGFELVWGFSCQVVVFGFLPVLCSEREGPFFVPSLAIGFAERAEGVKGPKR